MMLILTWSVSGRGARSSANAADPAGALGEGGYDVR